MWLILPVAAVISPAAFFVTFTRPLVTGKAQLPSLSVLVGVSADSVTPAVAKAVVAASERSSVVAPRLTL